MLPGRLLTVDRQEVEVAREVCRDVAERPEPSPRGAEVVVRDEGGRGLGDHDAVDEEVVGEKRGAVEVGGLRLIPGGHLAAGDGDRVPGPRAAASERADDEGALGRGGGA